MKEQKICPFCGSEKGYYMMEVVHRALLFDYNDEPCGASEDITEFCSRRRRCINCNKILPKKMFIKVKEMQVLRVILKKGKKKYEKQKYN